MPEPDHGSSRPPPAPPSAASPADDEWRPSATDESLRAVSYRARRGLQIAREVRTEQEELRGAISSLAANVGRLTGAVDAVQRLVAWALGIVGALAVAGAALKIWAWISTLHH